MHHCAFPGRERGRFWSSTLGGSCRLLVHTGVCWGRCARHRQPLQAGHSSAPAPGHRRGCLWACCLLSAPRRSWVGLFQSNTKSASCSLTPNQNLKSPLSFLFPWINCSSSPSLSCCACFPVRPLGLGSGGSESHTQRGFLMRF